MRGVGWILLAGLLTAGAGCDRGPVSASGKRMIVLGVDGMDPGFLEKHWAELPSLDRLRRQGDFRRLATTIPPQSPVAWSTLITGMDSGGHGIFDFIHRDPVTLKPFSSMAETIEPDRVLTLGPFALPLSEGRVRSLRKGRAFWELLAEKHIPATIFRMPANFPPVECEARSLAGMGTPDLSGTFGTFTYFTDDPQERTRDVPGGRIVRVALSAHHVALPIEGPVNTLRKDRPRCSSSLTIHVDPSEPVARIDFGENQLVLREREWSQWLPVEFPLIDGFASARGILRVYLRRIRPHFQFYVSPVNIDPAEPELPLSTPASYSRELVEALGPFYTQGIAEDTAALKAGILTREEFLVQSRQVLADSLRAFRYELDRFRDGLLFFYFSSIDQNSHVLWGRHEAELLEIYRSLDRAVGWAIDQARDATLLVLSDHGFTTFDRAVHLNTWLWREGFLALDDPANTGRENSLDRVDWSNTQAYSLGLNGIYLNRMGRETEGTLEPGPASDVVLKRLAARLIDFRDPKTGERVVETVYNPRELFHGEALEYAPDLIVGYRPGYRSSWQTALGGVPKETLEDNVEAWIGDHCIAEKYVPGVLLSSRRIRVADPRLYDVTATILAEFGVDASPGMLGEPIF